MEDINDYIRNFLNEVSGVRVICFFKNHRKTVVISFPRGKYIEYDHVNNIITPFKSVSGNKWKRTEFNSIDKNLCYKVYQKLMAPKKTDVDKINEKYTFAKELKKVTKKDYDLISKYEQRKKGNWSDG